MRRVRIAERQTRSFLVPPPATQRDPRALAPAEILAVALSRRAVEDLRARNAA